MPPMWYTIEISAGWNGFGAEDNLQMEDRKGALRGEALVEGVAQAFNALFAQSF